MEIYVTCDFFKIDDYSFLRKASISDSYFLHENTAIHEARSFVEFHKNKGRFQSVDYFKEPVETPSYIVLGSYLYNGIIIYFGVGRESLIE